MSSCHKHMRELSRVVSSVTTDHEISISKGNHIQVVIRCGEKERKLFSGKTPSDHRSLMNFKSTVRKAYNEMGGPATPRF